MEIVFLPKADEDLQFWIKTGNKAILKKIAKLTEAILENNYSGIGKPEALKFNLNGKWSRRISEEHRYVYQIEDEIILNLPIIPRHELDACKVQLPYHDANQAQDKNKNPFHNSEENKDYI